MRGASSDEGFAWCWRKRATVLRPATAWPWPLLPALPHRRRRRNIKWQLSDGVVCGGELASLSVRSSCAMPVDRHCGRRLRVLAGSFDAAADWGVDRVASCPRTLSFAHPVPSPSSSLLPSRPETRAACAPCPEGRCRLARWLKRFGLHPSAFLISDAPVP